MLQKNTKISEKKTIILLILQKMCEIIGKYKVVDTRAKKQLGTIVTDNHL